ncbi:MAG: hypothetical protein AAB417_02520 [Patescibacteria group bacterium]
MISRIKHHLSIVTIVLVSALTTFSVLWMRDVVRIVEPTTNAAASEMPQMIYDPVIEQTLSSGDSIDPDAIERDLRAIELHTAGEGLADIQVLLGNQ